jgi:hypothetical protein
MLRLVILLAELETKTASDRTRIVMQDIAERRRAKAESASLSRDRGPFALGNRAEGPDTIGG